MFIWPCLADDDRAGVTVDPPKVTCFYNAACTEDVLPIPPHTADTLSIPPHTADVPSVPPSTADVLPIPPDTADPETQWAFLEEGLNYIMSKTNPQENITSSKYMSLYTVATTYCTSSSTHSTIGSTVVASNRGTMNSRVRTISLNMVNNYVK
ncbi:hypothetical protein M405DRAFT_921475 [Rhizopogon salebrosus TDB-379]|nr:hypothetical protein M405DRAFT_921475 [Rhizopogon salebrosus TDB-379]